MPFRPALALALLAGPACADSFVLVPGAFAGAWAWDDVAAILRDAGHHVVAVELRGEGTRAAENGPDVTVEDHVADVLAAIESAPPPVILVAHSYGGRPATGAWDLARDRVAHAVWVEAPAPLTDAGLPADSRSLAFVVMMYPDAADSGMMPAPVVRSGTYDHPLTPMSLKALYGAVPLSAPLPDTPATFVHGTASSLPGLRELGEALRDRHGWDLVALDGGHDLPMDSAPALAAVLLDVAAATD